MQYSRAHQTVGTAEPRYSHLNYEKDSQSRGVLTVDYSGHDGLSLQILKRFPGEIYLFLCYPANKVNENDTDFYHDNRTH